MNTRKVLQLAAIVGLMSGCAKQANEEAGPPPGASEAPAGKKAGLPPMTTAECEAQGGQVVGDIGDGSIFHPDYTCASGPAPIGVIEPDASGPIAVEGSVCCPT